jgi:hypothetical protein
MLNNHQLLVLEAHLRILRDSTAQAAAVTLDELGELLRVYRLATSDHMRDCLLHGDFVGPGELLNQLFPVGHGG